MRALVEVARRQQPRLRQCVEFYATVLPASKRTASSAVAPATTAASDRFLRREARVAEKRSLDKVESLISFAEHLDKLGIKPITRQGPSLVQLNIGLTCNLACHHCHVESSPVRTETFSEADADRFLELLAASPSVKTIDITGGAPEMHGTFQRVVKGARALGIRVIDRCNLTILMKPLYCWVDPFLAQQGVDIIASMPCYNPENVNAQRGDGVFDDSISALQRLNALGYGKEGSGLNIDLVYNPGGATLPPDQKMLETAYKRELKKEFDIEFNSLFCITNMPIKRFADDLRKSGKLKDYMDLLVENFNVENVDNIMCRDMVHVGPDGKLYDCDFNFALGIPARFGEGHDQGERVSLHDIGSFADMVGQQIGIDKHCWGCVAGSGSS